MTLTGGVARFIGAAGFYKMFQTGLADTLGVRDQ
jgi:hypothetical protein